MYHRISLNRMSLELQSKIKALVSPRLLRRDVISSDSDDGYTSEAGVKAGDIIIINKADEKVGSAQKAHLEIVRDQTNLQANFYTDSNKTFHFGSLTVDKCKISQSTTDLRVIQVNKQEDDDLPSTGLLIKAKSEAEAIQWMSVMSR